MDVLVARRLASQPARLAADREELYELARAALLALGSPEASGTAPARR